MGTRREGQTEKQGRGQRDGNVFMQNRRGPMDRERILGLSHRTGEPIREGGK